MSKVGRLQRRRIGEILVNEALITSEQLEEALSIQKKSREPLGTILMDMGLVSEADIAKIICLQYQLPFICLNNYDFDEKLVQLFPKEFLHRHKMLPFDRVGEMLLIMVTEVPPDNVLTEIPKLTKLNAALYAGFNSELTQRLTSLVPLSKTAESKAGGAFDIRAETMEVLDKVLGSGRAEEDPEDDDLMIDEDEDDGKSGKEKRKGSTLIFDSGKQSFLEELDSTWDSIFKVAQSKDKKPKK